MKKSNLKKQRKGFSLIELVIVVAIIGILALMILPQFGKVTADAKLKTFESNYQILVTAMGMYQAGHDGNYPTSEADFDPYVNGGFPDDTTEATYEYDAATHTLSCDFELDGVEKHYTYPTGAGSNN